MNEVTRYVLALAAAAVCTSNTVADVAAYRDGGTTPIATATSGSTLAITLGDVTSDTIVRIFDSASAATTAPSLNVGSVTIAGSTSNGSRLSVLVANGSMTGFPSDAQLVILPGVVNFGTSSGGLVITNPSNSADTSLRDATTLALAASGNVTGSIDVGRVFRIQAFGVTNSSGGIVADSRAEGEYQETVNKAAALARAIEVAEGAFAPCVDASSRALGGPLGWADG